VSYPITFPIAPADFFSLFTLPFLPSVYQFVYIHLLYPTNVNFPVKKGGQAHERQGSLV
jgi:hypothetical protein